MFPLLFQSGAYPLENMTAMTPNESIHSMKCRKKAVKINTTTTKKWAVVCKSENCQQMAVFVLIVLREWGCRKVGAFQRDSFLII